MLLWLLWTRLSKSKKLPYQRRAHCIVKGISRWDKENDYTNTKINELRREFKGLHLKAENDAILSGKQAHYLVFSFVKNNTVMAATTGYTIVCDRVDELGAIAPNTKFVNIMPIFRTMKDSLSIQHIGLSASANSGSSNQNQLFGIRG